MRRPNLAVSTDLMVGFPGETPEEFEETLRFLREEEFSRVHIFPYSPREDQSSPAPQSTLPEGKGGPG